MKIYFAGSIRGGRDNQDACLQIIEVLKRYGSVLTEHIGDQKLSKKGEVDISDDVIFSRDIKLLEQCDVIIAEVTTPSLGVGYEIGIMENVKPILCLFQENDNIRLSAMLSGNKNLKIERYKDLSDIETIIKTFLHLDREDRDKDDRY